MARAADDLAEDVRYLTEQNRILARHFDAATAAIERVRAVHTKGAHRGGWCLCCAREWPCPTVVALTEEVDHDQP